MNKVKHKQARKLELSLWREKIKLPLEPPKVLSAVPGLGDKEFLEHQALADSRARRELRSLENRELRAKGIDTGKAEWARQRDELRDAVNNVNEEGA